MASPTRWTWVWVNSGSWWWTGRPGLLQFMGSQRVGHGWATELNWICYNYSLFKIKSAQKIITKTQWKLALILHYVMTGTSSCCCCCQVASVVSNSVRSHRQQPTRLPHPWDSPGKNTGVGCHFLLQCVKVRRESEAAQSCPTLSDPMKYSLPGSSIHGIFQASVLEWGAIAFSEGQVEGREN